jgi:3D (Asp-Asp-Asp) domain-containing protein
LIATLALATALVVWSPPRRALITYYCQAGVMSDGNYTEPGAVAVDPKAIPIGTELEIGGWTYRAEDTGAFIRGLHIDVYVRSCADAIRRGVRHAFVRQYRGWR